MRIGSNIFLLFPYLLKIHFYEIKKNSFFTLLRIDFFNFERLDKWKLKKCKHILLFSDGIFTIVDSYFIDWRTTEYKYSLWLATCAFILGWSKWFYGTKLFDSSITARTCRFNIKVLNLYNLFIFFRKSNNNPITWNPLSLHCSNFCFWYFSG